LVHDVRSQLVRSGFAPARATLAPSAGVGRAESRPSACRLHRPGSRPSAVHSPALGWSSTV